MKNLDIVLALRKSLMFGQMSNQELLTVAAMVNEKEYQANSLIVKEGDFDASMYLIVDGTITIQKSGSELFQLQSGQFFGEMALFEGGIRTVSALSKTSSKLLELNRRDMLSLIEEEPQIGIGICRALSRKVRMLNDRLAVLES